MSRNIITLDTEKGPVQVVMGYDRPLGELFLNVMPLDDSDDAEDDDDGYPCFIGCTFSCAEDIGSVLAGIGLPVPTAMLRAVDDDAVQNMGNVIRQFEPDGSMQVLHQG